MSYLVLQVAENELGYLEKASNYLLDDKTANAGYNNWTKYARDLDELKTFYNGPKNGFDWCDMFVDWCFYKAYGRDWAQKLLNQPDKSAGAGCIFSLQYFKQINRFFTNNPKAGDQIFFGKNPENAYHTGLVEKVDNFYVYTIEGNTSGASGVISNGGGVCRKKYPLNASYIAGYGRPNYYLVGDDGNQIYEEEEEMTQEKFNEMMNKWLEEQAKRNDVWPSSQEARNWAESNGFIQGDLNGNKMYKKFLTREEMILVLYRVLNSTGAI